MYEANRLREQANELRIAADRIDPRNWSRPAEEYKPLIEIDPERDAKNAAAADFRPEQAVEANGFSQLALRQTRPAGNVPGRSGTSASRIAKS